MDVSIKTSRDIFNSLQTIDKTIFSGLFSVTKGMNAKNQSMSRSTAKPNNSYALSEGRDQSSL